MHASVGDHLLVQGHKVGQGNRDGEIVQVLGPDGHPPYLVRWTDGHEAVFFPSSDTNLVETDEPLTHTGW